MFLRSRRWWPWRRFADAMAFRRLRRRLPGVHRAWTRTGSTVRPETDAEYLERLRAVAGQRSSRRTRDRFGWPRVERESRGKTKS